MYTLLSLAIIAKKRYREYSDSRSSSPNHEQESELDENDIENPESNNVTADIDNLDQIDVTIKNGNDVASTKLIEDNKKI